MTHDSKANGPEGLGIVIAHALAEIVAETMPNAATWSRAADARIASAGTAGIPLDVLARSRGERAWGVGSVMHALSLVLDGIGEVTQDGRVRLTSAELERRADAEREQRRRTEAANAERIRETQRAQLSVAQARSIGADGEGRDYLDVAAAFSLIPAAFSRSTGVLVLAGAGGADGGGLKVSCLMCGAALPYRAGDVGLRLPHAPTCAALPALAHYASLYAAMRAGAAA